MHGPARAPGLPDRIAAGWSALEGAHANSATLPREAAEPTRPAKPQEMS